MLNETILEERLAKLEAARSWSPRVISRLETLIRSALARLNPNEASLFEFEAEPGTALDGDEICLTEEVRLAPGVEEALALYPVRSVKVELKGVDLATPLYIVGGEALRDIFANRLSPG